MRRFALLVLAPLLVVSSTQAGTLPGWLTSVEQAKKTSAASGKPILVDLYADWCGWCKQLERQVYASPRFQEYATRFVLLRVDVEDQGEGSRLQQRFEAYSLPTTLIVDADLSRVGRLDGFLPTEAYLQALDRELADYRELLARFEKTKNSSDARLLQALAQELHDRQDGKRAAQIWSRLVASGKVTPGSLGLVQYRLADAWRLAGDLAKAQAALQLARREAEAQKDFPLTEATDLLAFRVVQELGECKRAIEAIQAFLKQYPASEHRTYARRSLRELQSKSSC